MKANLQFAVKDSWGKITNHCVIVSISRKQDEIPVQKMTLSANDPNHANEKHGTDGTLQDEDLRLTWTSKKWRWEDVCAFVRTTLSKKTPKKELDWSAYVSRKDLGSVFRGISSHAAMLLVERSGCIPSGLRGV